MRLTLTEEQQELRRTVRAFLEARSPETEVRRLMETEEGYDPATWREMATQLGLQGTIIPERYGGSGATWVELAIVFEEMGRALFCGPYFSTIALAANALMLSGDETEKARWLPRIASSQTVATVAFTEENGRWDPAAIAMEASREASGWRLRGRKTFVLDGVTADLVLVAARARGDLALFVVEGDAPGLERVPLRTLDQTRKQARLDFSRVPARRLEAEGDVLARTLDLAAVALSAEAAGGAEKALETSVEYAKIRRQFDRPIGSFQAIQHKCVDMLLEVESARTAAFHAAAVASERPDELPRAASLAKTISSEAFTRVATENIQVHGGIGFTWEHSAHLYFKRAKSSELLLGSPTDHREEFVSRIGL